MKAGISDSPQRMISNVIPATVHSFCSHRKDFDKLPVKLVEVEEEWHSRGHHSSLGAVGRPITFQHLHDDAFRF